MSFYVAVNSDASRKTFPGNNAAKFTTRLNKQIILNSEYNVAVSSIIKYWPNGIHEPLVSSRMKRDESVEDACSTTATPVDTTICSTIPRIFAVFEVSDVNKKLLSN